MTLCPCGLAPIAESGPANAARRCQPCYEIEQYARAQDKNVPQTTEQLVLQYEASKTRLLDFSNIYAALDRVSALLDGSRRK